MKYKFYSEIPDNEKRPVKSNDIKRIVQQYNGELYLIKDNKCVHKFYYPYDNFTRKPTIFSGGMNCE